MKFIREEMPQDTPSFKEWVYGPESQLTPNVDPQITECHGPCCVGYWEEEDEQDDLLDF